MLSKIKVVLGSLMLCGFALINSVEVKGATVITGPQTITAPGSYVLGNNIRARGDCIVIAADFVTLDLGGFTIRGDGTGLGITDRQITRRGITIRDGVITNFEIGVSLMASTSSIVERVKAIDNNNAGFDVGDSSLLIGNIAENNGKEGIHGGSFSTISESVARFNQDDGIACSPGCTIVNNTVIGSNLNASGIGSTVRSNTVTNGNIVADGTVIDNTVIGGTMVTNAHTNVRGNSVIAAVHHGTVSGKTRSSGTLKVAGAKKAFPAISH